MNINDSHRGSGWGLTISCDECSMQCTSACGDCVVTYLLSDANEQAVGGDLVELDRDQARIVELFGAAGMVPNLRFRVAG
jgi:hypothetical protein